MNLMPRVGRSRRQRAAGAIPPIGPHGHCGSGPRPFWSVMIPNHNRADLLAATLASVLAQDPGPDEMQIQVIDDASTLHDPESVVRDLAGDRVEFFRHPRNLGAPATFTTAIERARGRWVHILHSDDLVIPGFYDAYREVIDRRGCVMVVGRALQIDHQGHERGVSAELPATADLLDDPWQTIAVRHAVNFPAIVVARESYEQVGGFHPGLAHANDWEMWTRIAATGPVGVVAEPLAAYRWHDGSDTRRHQRSASYLRDPLAALDLVVARTTDAGRARELRAARHRDLAVLARAVGRRHAEGGDLLPALTSATWSARLDPTGRNLASAGRTVAIAAVRSTRRAPGGGPQPPDEDVVPPAPPQVTDGLTSL